MRKLYFSLTAILLFTAIPMHILLQSEDLLSGKSWCGIVKEKGYGAYPVHMSVQCMKKGSSCGTIQYPSLKCGGMLIYEGEEKGAYLFAEKIQWGMDKCYDGGKISLTRAADDSIHWLWFYPDGKLNVEGMVYILK